MIENETVSQPDTGTQKAGRTPLWKRLLPLGVLVAIVAVAFSLGLHRYLSVDALISNYLDIRAFVAEQGFVALLIFGAVYAVATALSFPAGWLLTVMAGLLFGWVAGTLTVMVGATIGACAIYWVARTALSDFFRARAGKTLNRLREGFKADEVSYMLFLRLVAAFPFSVVNFAPGVLGVSFSTYAWTTFVGIAPGTAAYAFAGEGLASVIEAQARANEGCFDLGQSSCDFSLDPSSIVTPQILIAFAALGVVALIPVAIKRLRGAGK
ncbi:TVP38/TMEM64 family protein [Cucumibacter marinus]|uniref:TVP38/TMEM64 family protein n=1 Tax=Cucumibacter marinus TaxID=1121252 RepID=UPI00040979C2|nr:TVP38/TMEM64 family protein [Cucumibacter marinus]